MVPALIDVPRLTRWVRRRQMDSTSGRSSSASRPGWNMLLGTTLMADLPPCSAVRGLRGRVAAEALLQHLDDARDRPPRVGAVVRQREPGDRRVDDRRPPRGERLAEGV